MRGSREEVLGRRRFLWATLIVVTVFVIDGLSGGSVRALARLSASSMWAAGVSAGDVVLGSGLFSTRRALERENQVLREERAQFQVHTAAYEILKNENESLRQLTRLVERESGITAPIASSLHSSPYGTFMIGAGTRDGVRPGTIVMAGDPQRGGFVVGRVESADARLSLVKALFAPQEAVHAVIRDVNVSLLGRGGGQARAEIPRGTGIKVGDVVIAPSLGGRAIGIVGALEEDIGTASERVYVRVPVNLNDVKFVYVLISE